MHRLEPPSSKPSKPGQSASLLHMPTMRLFEQRKQVQLKQYDAGTQVASGPQGFVSHELPVLQKVSSTDMEVQSEPGGQGPSGGGSQ